MSQLLFIEIEPTLPANATVIWLHGLGASGHDFEPIVEELQLPKEAAIRFIFPHAPEIAVTINAGYLMPAWYDILELTAERKINETQLHDSVEEVKKLLQKELDRGIKHERIILAGFSQGGAVAYHAALTYPKKLGGLLGLSTYFPIADSIAREPINQNIPILVCHGSEDQMVLKEQGERTNNKLIELGYQTEFKLYPMDHEICMQEVADISTFIQKLLL